MMKKLLLMSHPHRQQNLTARRCFDNV